MRNVVVRDNGNWLIKYSNKTASNLKILSPICEFQLLLFITATFEYFKLYLTILIIAFHDSGITYYFDNYFDF